MLLSLEVSAEGATEMVGKRFTEAWRLEGGPTGLEAGPVSRAGPVEEVGPTGEAGPVGLKAGAVSGAGPEKLEAGPVSGVGPAGLEVGHVGRAGPVEEVGAVCGAGPEGVGVGACQLTGPSTDALSHLRMLVLTQVPGHALGSPRLPENGGSSCPPQKKAFVVPAAHQRLGLLRCLHPPISGRSSRGGPGCKKVVNVYAGGVGRWGLRFSLPSFQSPSERKARPTS